ncbi:D-alanyl-D-alanine carboxypeptidase family protein [Lysobacter pythonis]|uniref:D-alanyl-D-alanine carboxypeptidase family protein n=1 Tax=Solilutibacter pythonis TaxID=2483112 RepID=A0A3M2HS75_9GAMM|nr:M15 family metallopeptidase [Lysobacter pythonis]RMH91105.1 D-alanyl-D-alanine carboxypeptidase family protein [Lysobacter pythonis]
MRPRPELLLNSPEIEIWPAWLLRARGNADARELAQARWVMRRKRDGRHLAVVDAEGGWRPLLPQPEHQAGFTEAVRWFTRRTFRRAQATHPARALPMHALERHLAALGLDAEAYAAHTGLARVAEPDWLAFAGLDRYRRTLWLTAPAARAWRRMQAAALTDGIVLEAVSGFRSHAYQLGIFERKRARGLGVEAILAVNAAPGFSEHHSGQALDIATPGEPPAEETFEATPAFGWLARHAADSGFHLSYPRGNPHGIVYEPWHWRHTG